MTTRRQTVAKLLADLRINLQDLAVLLVEAAKELHDLVDLIDRDRDHAAHQPPTPHNPPRRPN